MNYSFFFLLYLSMFCDLWSNGLLGSIPKGGAAKIRKVHRTRLVDGVEIAQRKESREYRSCVPINLLLIA